MSELALYKALFDENPRPIVVFDRDTLAILHANRAFAELYEWTPDELVTMTLRDIRDPADVPRLERAIAEGNAERQPFKRATRHRAKSGRMLDLDLEITRLSDGSGRVVSMAVITNMTGAADAERRFRLLVENCADGISITRADGVVEYMSPSAERLMGVGPGELVGRVSMETAHPDDVTTIRSPAPGEVVSNLVRARRRLDGEWRWFEATVTNLTHDPAVRGFVSNFRDITDRAEAARALQRWETNFRDADRAHAGRDAGARRRDRPLRQPGDDRAAPVRQLRRAGRAARARSRARG